VERGAFVKVDWFNWCGSRAPLEVEVALADSSRTLTVNDEGFGGRPRCDQPSARSLLSVGPFQPPE
jgi:hypothetical protein